MSNDAVCRLCKLASHWPCPLQNRFSMVNKWRRRSKPDGWVVGSDSKVWLTTEANYQASIFSIVTLMWVMSDHTRSWELETRVAWLKISSCENVHYIFEVVCWRLLSSTYVLHCSTSSLLLFFQLSVFGHHKTPDTAVYEASWMCVANYAVELIILGHSAQISL